LQEVCVGNSLRHVLVLLHPGQSDAVAAASAVCEQLRAAGIVPVVRDTERAEIEAVQSSLSPLAVLDEGVSVGEIECAIVLGGDGTILRAAELLRDSSAPLVGINLGHVGFLAETERAGIAEAVNKVIDKAYEVEERLTLRVRVKRGPDVVFETWALNESTVEKASRSRILEVVLEVDRRPLSSFSCDGVVMATPTGSTAYAFSAGGPVIWPTVDAMVLVPMSAHALFTRPIVVGPDSVMAVEILERSGTEGILWCDGRRSCDLPAGSRVVVTKSDVPVRLARLQSDAFTDTLVSKFELPVDGWRGPTTRD
jgi:NAD+ kinase